MSERIFRFSRKICRIAKKIAESPEYLKLARFIGGLSIKSATADCIKEIRALFLLLKRRIEKEASSLNSREKLDLWKKIRLQMPVISQLFQL